MRESIKFLLGKAKDDNEWEEFIVLSLVIHGLIISLSNIIEEILI